ncbi:MAG: hypothetical protein OET44_03645 [Gammaproteobacteria bacterium]|nr:hypothetical protein [Gammaproteobacteria bacterium]
MANALVPDDFAVPASFVGDGYRLEMLTPAVAELDYDAVISSKGSLRTVFSANDPWPAHDLTLADNVADLRKHESEFHARQAFAYTVLAVSGDLCLGCVYIYPSTVARYDCEMYLWVRSSALYLDEKLHNDMRAWLQSHWPFEQPAFPGREIPWTQWPGNRHI